MECHKGFDIAHVKKGRIHKIYDTYVRVELRKIIQQIQNCDHMLVLLGVRDLES